MNFLAHAFLARHTEAAMVGALLGDFAKADVWEKYPAPVALEIVVHRQIDSFTDRHPTTMQALELFSGPQRRFAGMALDVFYDHLLSRRWAVYSELPRQEFIARFYAALTAHQTMLPAPLRAILPSLVGHDWLARYHHMDGVEWAVTRMSQRLSKNGHLLRACLQDLHRHYADLEVLFDAFFPELVAFAPAARARVLASRPG